MRSTTRSFALLLAVTVSAALFGGNATAAGYPDHPINFIALPTRCCCLDLGGVTHA
jgi:hypothetical protein